jgi:hypothetical protein
VLRVTILILGVLAVIALLWIALELHYLGCVSAGRGPEGWQPVGEDRLSLPESPVEQCSRLPI